MPSTTLVPMADNLNHSSVGVTYEILNTKRDLKTHSKSKHIMKQYDYSLLSNSLNLTQPDPISLEGQDRYLRTTNVR